MARILSRVKCTPTSTKRLAENIANAAPVTVLSIIIMWSYLAYVFSLSGVLMMTNPVQASLYLIFYHPLFIMFVWSYYKAVSTDPGSPVDSIPSIHNDPTTFASPRPSTDHESEALQPLTTGAMFVQGGHQSEATVLHVESPLSTSTVNLLHPSHGLIRNGLGMGSGALFGRPHTVMVKRNGQRRYCQKCRSLKFDRTHHCSTCKKCVLKMDHHCPWINNCVGHHNQKAFHLFIIYGSIYCIYILATVVPPLVELINVPMGVLHMDFNWAFLILISAVFGLFLVPFTIFHTYQLLSNRTTIETYERAHYRMGDQSRRGHPDNGITTSKHLNIWDLGKRRNFMQVMGPVPKLWFLPINNSEGDGRTFPLNGYAYDTLSSADEDDEHEQQMAINVLAEESGDDSDN